MLVVVDAGPVKVLVDVVVTTVVLVDAAVMVAVAVG